MLYKERNIKIEGKQKRLNTKPSDSFKIKILILKVN